MVKVLIFVWLAQLHCHRFVYGDAATDFNLINNDGSFSFGASANDRGGFFHSARRTSNNVERGRYGSRNPSNGRIEETVYTAGPRGFRARGPNVYRKMDLSQVARGPIGAPGDPLADPYDDPNYSFSFRTADHQRREDADSTGRVRGLYSYIDDVGETHSVRYAAGANTGFEVLNAVPDAPSYVKYNAPLYKADRRTRGRVAYERGPGRQYKFITSGPDQRRSESTGPDGVTRGSYSYLDDKGVQRTIQYIAGPGIGYRVVQSTTGPGTHLLPRPAVPEFNIPYPQSNDIVDNEGSGFKTGGSRPFSYQNNRISTDEDGDDTEKLDRDPLLSNAIDVLDPTNTGNDLGSRGDSGGGSSNGFDDDDISGDDSSFHQDGSTPRPITGFRPTRPSVGSGSSLRPVNTAGNRVPGSSSGNSGDDDDFNGFDSISDTIKRPIFNKNNSNRNNIDNRHKPNRDRNESSGSGVGFRDDNYDESHDRDRDGPASSSPSNDWRKRARHSTIIKNVGSWYVGLPPGVAVRAHVQNIDLLPAGHGVESPGQAAKREDNERYLKIF